MSCPNCGDDDLVEIDDGIYMCRCCGDLFDEGGNEM